MLTVIDRYFLAEITKVFTAIMATLLMVMSSMLFLRTLEEVNVGALNGDIVLRFLGFQILRDTSSLLPPAFFIAVLVTLGRMARDSELIALHACGLGPMRIYRALIYCTLPLSLIAAVFSLQLQPFASTQIQQIREMQKEKVTQIAGLQAGRFYQQEGGRVTFYASAIDEGRRFRDVFVQDRRGDQPILVLSEKAYYQEAPATGERSVVLEAGRRYDGAPGEADYGIADFARYQLNLEEADAAVEGMRRRRASQATSVLLRSDWLPDRVEIQHRLASPAAIFALALLAIPLTTLSPRQGGAGRMFLAFFAYFAFFNLQGLAENWMGNSVTPAWIGTLWYQVLVVAMVYAVLLPESYWLKRLLRR